MTRSSCRPRLWRGNPAIAGEAKESPARKSTLAPQSMERPPGPGAGGCLA
jgi:hypothetical protein